MRLVTFEVGSKRRIGTLLEDKIIDLTVAYFSLLCDQGCPNALETAATKIPPDIICFLEGGADSLDAAMEALNYVKEKPNLKESKGQRVFYEKREVKLKAPVPRPPKILNIGLNHRDLILSRLSEIPKKPIMFLKAPTTVIGDHDNIVLPPNSESRLTTTEIELGVVVGKRARMVPAEKAWDVVLGYTVINDITAQDMLRLVYYKTKSLGELLLGRRLETEPPERILSDIVEMKSMDTFCPMGPCIVTKDEIHDPHNLFMTCKVNGEIAQDGSTADLYWKIPEIIEVFSKILTLEPGDIICTGTCRMTSKAILKAGDVVQSTIDKIGTITNYCVAWDSFGDDLPKDFNVLL